MDLALLPSGPAVVAEPERFRTLAATQEASQQGRAVLVLDLKQEWNSPNKIGKAGIWPWRKRCRAATSRR